MPLVECAAPIPSQWTPSKVGKGKGKKGKKKGSSKKGAARVNSTCATEDYGVEQGVGPAVIQHEGTPTTSCYGKGKKGVSSYGSLSWQDSTLHRIWTGNGWVDTRVSTTRGLPNRERDKERVERTLGLPEFGREDVQIYFQPHAAGDTRYLPAEVQSQMDALSDERKLTGSTNEKASSSGKRLVATGYARIVYGDHGPYVELQSQHVAWESFPFFFEKPDYSYYDEYFAENLVMLYAQKKYVNNKKNPPKTGDWFAQNYRAEGYANYVPGMHYISASSDVLFAETVDGKPLGSACAPTDQDSYAVAAAPVPFEVGTNYAYDNVGRVQS
ncbi:unnamed protein product [Amoebophrya sp. A25]|nr:unnamed protein product [Amoebophrya sp. A25]|eukprot:GSA25T00007546001.1